MNFKKKLFLSFNIFIRKQEKKVIRKTEEKLKF